MNIHKEKTLTQRERDRQIRFFLKRVTILPGENECWIFDAHRERWGYGSYIGERAHRVSYRLYNKGCYMKGKEISHLCEIQACVNPDHLKLCTHRANYDCTWDNIVKLGGFSERRDFLDKKVKMLKDKYIQLVSKVTK